MNPYKIYAHGCFMGVVLSYTADMAINKWRSYRLANKLQTTDIRNIKAVLTTYKKYENNKHIWKKRYKSCYGE